MGELGLAVLVPQLPNFKDPEFPLSTTPCGSHSSNEDGKLPWILHPIHFFSWQIRNRIQKIYWASTFSMQTANRKPTQLYQIKEKAKTTPFQKISSLDCTLPAFTSFLVASNVLFGCKVSVSISWNCNLL